MNSKVERVRGPALRRTSSLLALLLLGGCAEEVPPSTHEESGREQDQALVLAQQVVPCGKGNPEVAACGQAVKAEGGKIKVSVNGQTTEVAYKLIGTGNRKLVMQGDILLGYEGNAASRASARAAAVTVELGKLWPNGRIPFEFDKTWPPPNPAGLLAAMREWESLTPVRFVEHTTEVDFVAFNNGMGCLSPVGRQGGKQWVDLMGSCEAGQMLHELGHVIGLFHEQSRTDRDRYVKVNTANVEPDFLSEFAVIAGVEGAANYGPYDFESIMHYPSNAFPIDRTKPTIEVLPGIKLPAGFTPAMIGQREHPSSGDVAAVRFMYSAR